MVWLEYSLAAFLVPVGVGPMMRYDQVVPCYAPKVDGSLPVKYLVQRKIRQMDHNLSFKTVLNKVLNSLIKRKMDIKYQSI